MITFLLMFLSMLSGGFVQMWIMFSLRKPAKPTPPSATNADADDEDENTDETFLGFPSRSVAEFALSRLGTEAFNVSCPFCKAKKPKWDVLAHASFPVGQETTLSSLVLSCPSCASVRLVNPYTLGAVVTKEDGEVEWRTGDSAP